MGNLLFLAGLMLMIGLRSTFLFFFQLQKWKGSALFFGGFALIMIGWPVFGVLLELGGGFFLFGGFIPTLIQFAKSIPIIGPIFSSVSTKHSYY
jgi:hypothetical protein